MDDLKHGSKRGLRWDWDETQNGGKRAVDFFPDVLRLAEGEHAGQPFVLQLWQVFVIGSLFGWKSWNEEKQEWFRRFRVAYIEIGKGNGKSPMVGGTGIYMMIADGEIGAHCFAAATTREQANILFQDAVHMVDASPALSSRITQSGKRHVFNLAHLPSGSFFRPISSERKGLDGKRVHFAGLDEVHEHPNPMVVDKMRANTKGRRQALIFEITNSGYNRHSVCWDHHEYSRKVLEGTMDDSWFAYVCTLDPCAKCKAAGKTQPDGKCKQCDDWRNEKVWKKVNPNLGVSVTLQYLREQVREAVGMPSKENIVKRLNFCIWTEQSERWMPMDAWDASSDQVPDLDGEQCFGGLDLAMTRDMSAFVLVFPPTGERKHWIALPFYWIPEEDIEVRTKRDGVPYALWRDEGILRVTAGNVTDFDVIERDIIELAKQYSIQEIAYDPFKATQLVTHLQDAGLTMVEMVQTCRNLNPGMRAIEKQVLGKKLVHGQHPVLRWNVSNTSACQDANGAIKPDKKRSTERIDGVSALASAETRANVVPTTGYTDPEVFSVEL